MNSTAFVVIRTALCIWPCFSNCLLSITSKLYLVSEEKWTCLYNRSRDVYSKTVVSSPETIKRDKYEHAQKREIKTESNHSKFNIKSSLSFSEAKDSGGFFFNKMNNRIIIFNINHYTKILPNLGFIYITLLARHICSRWKLLKTILLLFQTTFL